jgi:glutamate dehydrogenase
VGEGGNRGFTQNGRIEYWMQGGLINTDALDNSGGVDTSDHEVNLKILLDILVKKGIIKSKEERNQLLAGMAEEVAALVLADNVDQSRALSLDGLRSAARYEQFVDLVDEMLDGGLIDKSGAQIPSRDLLLQSPQKKRGLPRPLLADLLGYAKMWGFDKLVQSKLTESPLAHPFLDAYFPVPLQKKFGKHFAEHPLRREIIATAVINHVLNNGGIGILSRLRSSSKATVEQAVSAYLNADHELNATTLRQQSLQAGLEAEAEHAALLKIENELEAAALRILG